MEGGCREMLDTRNRLWSSKVCTWLGGVVLKE